MKYKTVRAIFFIFILLSAVFILANPYEATYYCSSALKLCINSLIPSLFIYMVLSKIMSFASSSGLISGRITHLISRILNLPEALVPICFFGLFCGAPSGAFTIGNIYSGRLCTKQEAERACVLSNNCSAAFIMSVAATVTGTGVYYILISNILATVTVYMLFFRSTDKPSRSTYRSASLPDITKIITDSINSCTQAVLRLCGYVLFFYTFGCIISQKVSDLLSFLNAPSEVTSTAKAIICALSEMTLGVLSSGFENPVKSTVIISSCIAFSGLSVIFQVKSILADYGLSALPYIKARCLCASLCPIYTLIFIFLSPTHINVSSNISKTNGGITFGHVISLVLVTVISFIGAAILSYLDKKHKNS